MNREIKFRAWDKDIKKYLGHSWPKMRINSDGTFQFLTIDELYDIQQFTGLKDSEGKEIYEGDVIYLAGYGDYEVEWPFRQLYEAAAEKDIGKIKGNIYENPELLTS